MITYTTLNKNLSNICSKESVTLRPIHSHMHGELRLTAIIKLEYGLYIESDRVLQDTDTLIIKQNMN